MKKWLVGLVVAGLCAASAWAADDPSDASAEGITNQMTIYVINLMRQSVDNDDSDELEFGDAVLVESGEKYLLMDTGAAYTRDSVIGYLKAVGVDKLEGLYLSHLHSDHMGNYDAILEEFHPERVYLPDTSIGEEYVSVASSTPIADIYDSLAKRAGGANVVYLKKGSSFSFGTVEAKVLGPVGHYSLSDFKNDKYGRQSGHYLNNCSLSTMLTCGKTTFLTCGDIEQVEEEALLAEYGKGLKANIFKLNHHGLLSSNGEDFLAKVRPTFSFLSNNGYEGTTNVNGNTVTKHHTIIERMQKYGIPYMLGNEGAPVIYEVENDAISMYRDGDGDGQMKDESELFKDGWNYVLGISMTSNGVYNGTNDYYFVNGKPLGGIRKIDGRWYHFADGGALQKGLYKQENGKWVFSGYRRFGEKLRYYNPDGTVTIGFANITNKGKTYLFYFDDEGFRVNGDAKWTPVEIKGKKYALNENGVVFNNGGKGGWKTYGKKYRYFSKKGVMATEWKTLNGIKYYFDPTNGYRCTGLVEIGESTYYFNSSGKLVTNKTVTVDGKSVTLDKNGKVSNPKVGTVKEVKATSKDAKNTVKWKKVSGAKGYVVYRATKKAGTYKVVKTVTDGATVKFTDKKVTVGKKYYYKVCAYKTIAKVKIKGKPSTAVSVSVAKGGAKGVTAKAGAKSAAMDGNEADPTVGVEGEEPPSGMPEITGMRIDADANAIRLVFTGTVSSVWATSDPTDPESWTPVEDAVIQGDTITVPLGKPFLRLQ